MDCQILRGFTDATKMAQGATLSTLVQLSPLHTSMLLWYCSNHGNIAFREMESRIVKTHENWNTDWLQFAQFISEFGS
jgi:hypothetical protein